MVKQGDIILIDFNPVVGHEQGKRRPALVISSNDFNGVCGGLIMVCPISHANDFPYHVDLPEDLNTDGKVLCQHVRTFDINARGYSCVESVPKAFLKRIVGIVKSCLDL